MPLEQFGRTLPAVVLPEYRLVVEEIQLRGSPDHVQEVAVHHGGQTQYGLESAVCALCSVHWSRV